MKKKLILINISLMMVVLFSILFQSFHSYEHLVKQFAEKKCPQHYSSTKTEFTHHHPAFDNCFVCEFTFSGFISPEKFSYQLAVLPVTVPYFFTTSEESISSYEAYCALRGPPYFTI